MDSPPDITYSLAVHNSASFLEAHMLRLRDRLARFGSAEMVLVENGSDDGSLQLAHRLAARLATPTFRIRVATVPRGLGHAHRRGLELARGRVIVVIGADLPFGFTDLDQWVGMPSPPELVLGSKSHPDSHLQVSVTRRTLSAVFGVARRGILGVDPGDTQGSIIIDGDIGRRLAPMLRCTNYLVTTEIVAWAMHLGARTISIPVDYPDPGRSTVRPVRDGVGMLAGMVALRRRLRAQR
jgi:dolichyl-phosphate beta-glucosyltransferase